MSDEYPRRKTGSQHEKMKPAPPIEDWGILSPRNFKRSPKMMREFPSYEAYREWATELLLMMRRTRRLLDEWDESDQYDKIQPGTVITKRRCKDEYE